MGAGDFGKGIVVGIERFKYQDFIAGIAEGQGCQLQRFTAAGGNINIFLAVFHAPFPVVFLDLVNKVHIPLGRTIGHRLFIEAADGFHELGRRFNIRLSDVQMINFLPRLLRFHGIRSQSANRRSGQAQCSL